MTTTDEATVQPTDLFTPEQLTRIGALTVCAPMITPPVGIGAGKAADTGDLLALVDYVIGADDVPDSEYIPPFPTSGTNLTRKDLEDLPVGTRVKDCDGDRLVRGTDGWRYLDDNDMIEEWAEVRLDWAPYTILAPEVADTQDGEQGAVFVHDVEGLEALPVGSLVVTPYGHGRFRVEDGWVSPDHRPLLSSRILHTAYESLRVVFIPNDEHLGARF